MKRLLVKAGECAVSTDPDVILEAKSLGSTLGVCVQDLSRGVAGMAVVVLPRIPPKEDRTDGFRALDAVSGLQNLFLDCLAAGAQREKLDVWLVGAAQFMEEPKDMALGVQVYAAARKVLEKNKIKVRGEHVGGQVNRSVELAVSRGGLKVRLGGQKEVNL